MRAGGPEKMLKSEKEGASYDIKSTCLGGWSQGF